MRRSGLTLCIINHNGARYLPRTLASVLVDEDLYEEILLVDNASTDRGLEIVRAQYPEVRLIELDENLGPGRARNVGLETAKTDRVMFIDNDVMPEPGCTVELSRAMDEHDHVALAMATILYDANPSVVQFGGAGCHFMGLQILEHAEEPVAELDGADRQIGSLVTACFLVDRTRWPGTRLFDESFFLYLEDHELGLRGRLLGASILAVPGARCRHREGTIGVSIRQTGVYTRIRIRNTIRNRWQLILKDYQLRSIVLLIPALLAFEVFQLAGVASRGWLGHWVSSIGWVGRSLPEIARCRRELGRARRRGDGRLLRGGPLPFNPALVSGRIERLALRLLEAVCGLNWLLARPLLSMRDDAGPETTEAPL